MWEPVTVYITSKPVGFELNSNMQMYYVFGNHIYSLSSMTTYVFFVWQIYFVLCIYANNFGYFTDTGIMPMKC